MDRHRLDPVDAAWLSMEEPDNPMMITGLLRFDAPVDWEDFRAVVAERLVGRYPRFSQRVDMGRAGAREAAWVDDDLDLDDHLVHERLPAPGDDDALLSRVGQLMGAGLDLSRSPWRLHLVDDFRGGSAVVALLHHSLADGIALASVLLGLADEVPPAEHAPPAPRPTARQRLRRAATAAAVPLELARLLTRPADPATPLHGALSGRKRVAWSEPLDLDEVKAVARGAGASVNDVLLAMTAGAVRTVLAEDGVTPVDVTASVPVNLRPLDRPVPRDLGNRFGLVFVPLPASRSSAGSRLRAARAAVAAKRSGAQALMTLVTLQVLGRSPRWVERLVVRVVGRGTTLVVTNVPGPTRKLVIGTSRLDGVMFWVPQAGRVAVGVSLLSYAGQVVVGVVADAVALEEPQRLSDALRAELDVLRDDVSGVRRELVAAG